MVSRKCFFTGPPSPPDYGRSTEPTLLLMHPRLLCTSSMLIIYTPEQQQKLKTVFLCVMVNIPGMFVRDFIDRLTEDRRLCLNGGITFPYRGQSRLSTSIRFSLLADWGHNVTGCLVRLLPCSPHHDGLYYPTMRQNEPILPKVDTVRYLVTATKKYLIRCSP